MDLLQVIDLDCLTVNYGRVGDFQRCRMGRAGVAEWLRVLCCGMLGHGFDPHQYLWTWLQVRRYGLAAMLTGVTPEVNLRNLLHAGEKAHQ